MSFLTKICQKIPSFSGIRRLDNGYQHSIVTPHHDDRFDKTRVSVKAPQKSVRFQLDEPKRPEQKASDSLKRIEHDITSVVDLESTFERLKSRILSLPTARGDLAFIINQCDLLIALKPRSAAVLTIRSIAFRMQGDPLACVADCNAILQVEPDNKYALLHRATAICDKKIFFDADKTSIARYVADGKKKAEENPDERYSILVKSLLLGWGNESDALVRSLANIVDLAPDDIVAATALMAVYLARRSYGERCDENQKMIAIAKQVIAMDPKNGLAAGVLWRVNGEKRYLNYPISRFGFSEAFADFPIFLQDKDLTSYVRGLYLEPVST